MIDTTPAEPAPPPDPAAADPAVQTPTGAPPATDGAATDPPDSRPMERCLARDYPYPFPRHCYLYLEGVALPILHGGSDGPRVDTPVGQAKLDDLIDPAQKRTPVLAFGSNQAPEQLARKYGHLEGAAAAIPVMRGRLREFDTVYAAHITSYGAIAATVHRSPGTAVEVAITYLTDPQLELMHRSEARGINYDFVRLPGIRLELDGGGRLDTVFAYVCRAGALAEGGEPIGLASIRAEGRRYPTKTMSEVLSLAQDRLNHFGTHDQLIETVRGDAERRQAWAGKLAEGALSFNHPGTERIIG